METVWSLSPSLRGDVVYCREERMKTSELFILNSQFTFRGARMRDGVFFSEDRRCVDTRARLEIFKFPIWFIYEMAADRFARPFGVNLLRTRNTIIEEWE